MLIGCVNMVRGCHYRRMVAGVIISVTCTHLFEIVAESVGQ